MNALSTFCWVLNTWLLKCAVLYTKQCYKDTKENGKRKFHIFKKNKDNIPVAPKVVKTHDLQHPQPA